MANDEQFDKTKGKECIEILIENLWIPAMASTLITVDRNGDTHKVKSLRVRKFEDEIEK